MVLLGLAEHLYPHEKAELTVADSQRLELEAERRRFVQVLDDISTELLDAAPRAGLTEETLNRAVQRTEARRDELLRDREAILHAITAAVHERESARSIELAELQAEWAGTQKLAQQYATTLQNIEERLSEIRAFETVLDGELSRLNRALAAGESLSPLKVTRCPVCEQSVENRLEKLGQCFLCGQETMIESASSEQSSRVEAEILQLKAELDEAQQSTRQLLTERELALKNRSIVQERFNALEARLRPYRSESAALVPPELSATDVQIGVAEEKVRQLNRLKVTLKRRDELSENIRLLDERITQLERAIVEQEQRADFVAAADALSEGMNEFLNRLNEASPGAWQQGRIHALLSGTGFDFFVADGRWSSKLGGTMTLYFLLAYHFGLLRLSGDPARRYPGICVIDLPPQLDEAAVVEMEKFIVRPFLDLANNSALGAPVQAILTGSSFEAVEGANRIELTQVWT